MAEADPEEFEIMLPDGSGNPVEIVHAMAPGSMVTGAYKTAQPNVTRYTFITKERVAKLYGLHA